MRHPGRAADAFTSVEQEPDERLSVAEQVARRLLELIQSGNLRPGEQLPSERELAAMLAVSQPTVREALRGLQILGAIRWTRSGTCYVSSLELSGMLAPLQFLVPLNENNVETLYQARVLIDGGIGRMAARLISDGAIKRLRELVTIQEGLANNPAGFRVSDLEFHQIILDACGNPFLDRIANSLYTLGMEYRRVASETPGVIAQSVRDHAAIVDGLSARDPDMTGAAMEEHMRNVDRTTRAAMMQLASSGKLDG
ncbi:FadR/GntR family transcriptional regulator [Arvimicrobium flavum]|uniref:FadR/GntR family transcriptional regulator n=1 Tax=Arvimicrobium flavum TaxID=3393320 RepID=UPI00237BE364|nr:FadR/GntR family transcriptional regulator [Mesorhizobium shangrilense]